MELRRAAAHRRARPLHARRAARRADRRRPRARWAGPTPGGSRSGAPRRPGRGPRSTRVRTAGRRPGAASVLRRDRGRRRHRGGRRPASCVERRRARARRRRRAAGGRDRGGLGGDAMTQHRCVTDIGELVTNDPARSTAPLGIADAALVVEDGRVAWVGPAGDAPGRRPAGRRRAAARCCPGFVDSHAHLVFAGDRAAEFAARMAGEPLHGGGIRDHGRRHPRRDRRRAARQRCAALVAEMRAPGHHDRRDQERLRPDRRRRGARAADRRRGHRRDHVPRRARRARRVRRPADDYVDLVTGADARRLRAARPLGRRVLRAGGALRRRRGPRGPRGRAAPPGCGLRVHANQLGHGPGRAARRRAGRGQRRPLHAPDRRRRRRARRRRTTVATLLPGAEFSTRSPYPDARRLLDAGRHRRAGHRLQPRLVATRRRCRSASRSRCARWA